MTALPARLDVTADLTLSVDGEAVQVIGRGDRLTVDLPSLRAGRTLLRSGLLRKGRAERLAAADAALREAGLAADVRLNGRTLARMGAGAQPGSLTRLLGLGGIEVRPVARRSTPGLILAGLAALAALGVLLWRQR